MTYSEYMEACANFAKDTRKWESLDPYKFYTTDGTDWRETCDNAHGGLDVKWAFHETPETIVRSSNSRLREIVRQFVEQGEDEGWDFESIDKDSEPMATLIAITASENSKRL